MRPYCLLLLLLTPALYAEEDFTVYDLLAPDSHKFAIVYDVVVSKEHEPFYLNPIRKGAKVSDERVIDLATGKPLKHGNEPMDARWCREFRTARRRVTGRVRVLA